MKYKLLLATGICLALSASSFAQISKSGGGYLLRMKYKAGTIHKYTVVTNVGGLPPGVPGATGGSMVLSGPLTQTVKSVTASAATVVANIGPFKMKGSDEAMSPAQNATFQMDSTGNIIGNVGGGFGVRFPKATVKVGGTWTAVAALPGTMGGTGEAKTTYRFNGIKTVGKKKLASVTLSIPSFSMVKTGNGEAFLSPLDGSLVSMTLTLTIANPQGGPDMKVTTAISPSK